MFPVLSSSRFILHMDRIVCFASKRLQPSKKAMTDVRAQWTTLIFCKPLKTDQDGCVSKTGSIPILFSTLSCMVLLLNFPQHQGQAAEKRKREKAANGVAPKKKAKATPASTPAATPAASEASGAVATEEWPADQDWSHEGGDGEDDLDGEEWDGEEEWDGDEDEWNDHSG